MPRPGVTWPTWWICGRSSRSARAAAAPIASIGQAWSPARETSIKRRGAVEGKDLFGQIEAGHRIVDAQQDGALWGDHFEGSKIIVQAKPRYSSRSEITSRTRRALKLEGRAGIEAEQEWYCFTSRGLRLRRSQNNLEVAVGLRQPRVHTLELISASTTCGLSLCSIK